MEPKVLSGVSFKQTFGPGDTHTLANLEISLHHFNSFSTKSANSNGELFLKPVRKWAVPNCGFALFQNPKESTAFHLAVLYRLHCLNNAIILSVVLSGSIESTNSGHDDHSGPVPSEL